MHGTSKLPVRAVDPSVRFDKETQQHKSDKRVPPTTLPSMREATEKHPLAISAAPSVVF